MKAKLLSFAFIYFSGSGLFKVLRAEKIKNPSFAELAFKVVREKPQGPTSSPFLSLAGVPQKTRGFDPRVTKL
jgi:hypothetical protein